MRLDALTAPIHAVLESHLAPKDLAYALRLWSEQFVTQENPSLKRYVDSFYDRQTLSLRNHELYNQLLPAMLEVFETRVKHQGESLDPYDFPDYDLVADDISVEDDLPDDGAETLESVEQDVPLHQNEAPIADFTRVLRIERYEVFSLFIRSLCNKIPEDRRTKLFERYTTEIKGCCVFPVGTSFYSWLISDLKYFEDEGLAIADMSKIIHILYMGMCDYIGPVEADTVLTQAASETAYQFPNAALNIDDLL